MAPPIMYTCIRVYSGNTSWVGLTYCCLLNFFLPSGTMPARKPVVKFSMKKFSKAQKKGCYSFGAYDKFNSTNEKTFSERAKSE